MRSAVRGPAFDRPARDGRASQEPRESLGPAFEHEPEHDQTEHEQQPEGEQRQAED
jgi:hypothetical protein